MLIDWSRLAIVFLAAFSLAAGQGSKAFPNETRTRLLLGERVLLDSGADGFLSIHRVLYSPGGDRFAVIACGYECNDNIGFLFNADGSGKRKFTGRWDSILQDKLEWSADSRRLYYYRINSSGAEVPKIAPAKGWVEVNAATGRKQSAASRMLKPSARYAVFNVPPNDLLNVRERPDRNSKVVGQLAHDAQNIRVGGNGARAGKEVWVKITHESVSGWVNQNYLYERAPSPKQQ